MYSVCNKDSSDAWGDVAEELIGDGVAAFGHGVDMEVLRALLTEDHDLIPNLDLMGDMSDIDHTDIHADLTHDGAEGFTNEELSAIAHLTRETIVVTDGDGGDELVMRGDVAS